MTRRVVITGMGTVNPLADTLPGYWEALLAGRSVAGPIEQFDVSAFKVRFGCEVKNFAPEKILGTRDARRLDRFAQFAMIAGAHAVADSGIDFSREPDPYRCGVIYGSGIGGVTEFETEHAQYIKLGPSRTSPFVVPKMIVNSAAGSLSIKYGLCGPNTAIATACPRPPTRSAMLSRPSSTTWPT